MAPTTKAGRTAGAADAATLIRDHGPEAMVRIGTRQHCHNVSKGNRKSFPQLGYLAAQLRAGAREWEIALRLSPKAGEHHAQPH